MDYGGPKPFPDTPGHHLYYLCQSLQSQLMSLHPLPPQCLGHCRCPHNPDGMNLGVLLPTPLRTVSSGSSRTKHLRLLEWAGLSCPLPHRGVRTCCSLRLDQSVLANLFFPWLSVKAPPSESCPSPSILTRTPPQRAQKFHLFVP